RLAGRLVLGRGAAGYGVGQKAVRPGPPVAGAGGTPVGPGGGPPPPRQSDVARLRARPPLQRLQRRTPRPPARAIRPRAGASAAIDRSAVGTVDAPRSRAGCRSR